MNPPLWLEAAEAQAKHQLRRLRFTYTQKGSYVSIIRKLAKTIIHFTELFRGREEMWTKRIADIRTEKRNLKRQISKLELRCTKLVSQQIEKELS